VSAIAPFSFGLWFMTRTNPPPAEAATATPSAVERLFAETDAALRAADPTAFPVTPRLVRRVIAQDLGLAGVGFSVPHRKSWVISSERVQRMVDPEELGLESFDYLPASVILLARPDEDEANEFSRDELLVRSWRMLFHARVDLLMKERVYGGGLSAPKVRERIDQIGQVEFDEIQSVLERERLLIPDFTRADVYIEFVAVFLELHYFSPDWLGDWFPSLSDLTDVRGLLAQDVDAERLFQACRPKGAPDQVVAPPLAEPSATEAWADQVEGPAVRIRSDRQVRAWLQRAERLTEQGNSVRAIRLTLEARDSASGPLAAEARDFAERQVEALAGRLSQALELPDEDRTEWGLSLRALLSLSRKGFWNPDTRLLYDLQNVCIDFERDVFVIDALVWLWSLGRRPLRRSLPHQRDVLMSRHLRSATRRMAASRLGPIERTRLSGLLRSAAARIEQRTRKNLAPLLREALDEVDLKPHNTPERVAHRKIVEECLDQVVERGFLTLGQVRDVLSRNDLKLSDVSSWRDLVFGDQLLRLNRSLTSRFDGVYHPAEFYLRWLQGLSAIAFGTVAGRFVTSYILLPFGGAFLLLEGLNHLIHAVQKLSTGEHSHGTVVTWPIVLGLGAFLFSLLHSEAIRGFTGKLAWTLFVTIRDLLLKLPAKLLRYAGLKAFLRSTPVVLFRRYLFLPMLFTGLAWFPLSRVDFLDESRFVAVFSIFMIFNLILNSRVGRMVEEASSELFAKTWHTVRTRVFVALYDAVMDAFKRMLEWVERFIYAVDEWLRFKSGESSLSLYTKAVLGVFWGAVAFVIRFCVNLLIEPQINPIKHFPVVTVSHKIILPLTPMLSSLLTPTLGKVWANTVAGAVIFGCPGIFGFLVWELKENWRLFAANRPRTLKPVQVGHHGETIIRLMRPGFHSGTLPKLYARLRKAHRRRSGIRRQAGLTRYAEQLHHLEESLHRFFDRELLALLCDVPEWKHRDLSLGSIHLACNSLQVELSCLSVAPSPLRLALQEQAGWVTASILDQGWLAQLNETDRLLFESALLGFYQKCGVDLVRERIEAALQHRPLPYDIAEGMLVVWPGEHFEHEVVYPVTDARHFWPRPQRLADQFDLPRLDADEILLTRKRLTWPEWVARWKPSESAAEALARRNRLHLLPLRERNGTG
jgi:hypothetical protein